MIELTYKLLDNIRDVITHTRNTVYHAINTTMVQSYWDIGRLIVEEEQNEQSRAQYGKQQLKQLSAQFGKGFDASNLRNMCSFFLCFPKCDALSHTLSWTHYQLDNLKVCERDLIQTQLAYKSTQKETL